MTLLASAPIWLAAIPLLLLLLAAWEDGRRMEISDWISVAIAATALAAFLLAGPALKFWENLALSATVFGLGALLFRLGGMGGGDVKLAAASALWFGLSDGWKLLVVIAMIGGVETLILLAIRRLPWPEATRNKALPLRKGEGIPYGIAIALGVAVMGWWLRR